jgi:NAD(P)-dependent dehydrogenase (short-subunit alcohol dehydrogenase family)
MLGDLQNARMLVIGGTSGIGYATAMRAAAAGAAVTIASRSKKKVEYALAALRSGIQGSVLDTTRYGLVERFFAGEAPWDHVVVSAAQTESGPVRTLSLEGARASMESKFWGAYHVARAAKIFEGGSLTLVSGFLSVRPSSSAVLQGATNCDRTAISGVGCTPSCATITTHDCGARAARWRIRKEPSRTALQLSRIIKPSRTSPR